MSTFEDGIDQPVIDLRVASHNSTRRLGNIEFWQKQEIASTRRHRG
jgi:hypothetical protein